MWAGGGMLEYVGDAGGGGVGGVVVQSAFDGRNDDFHAGPAAECGLAGAERTSGTTKCIPIQLEGNGEADFGRLL